MKTHRAAAALCATLLSGIAAHAQTAAPRDQVPIPTIPRRAVRALQRIDGPRLARSCGADRRPHNVVSRRVEERGTRSDRFCPPVRAPHVPGLGAHSPRASTIKIIEDAGGQLNGSTNNDRTNYYDVLPNNYLETALWLESDRMGALLAALDQAKLDNKAATW